MNSSHGHLLCITNPQNLRISLNCLVDLTSFLIPFTETNVLQIYEKATPEAKNELYHHIMNTPVIHESLVVPFQSELCIPTIHSSVTLLSQILGLDDDRSVIEVMLGFFIYLSQSGTKATDLMSF